MSQNNNPETDAGTMPETPQVPPAPPQAEPLPLPGAPAEPDPYEKSPGLAAFLSLIPGLGYLYVGAYQRAVMIVVSVFLAIYLLPVPVSIFAPIFIWFFGMFDSYRQAQIANYGAEEPRQPDFTSRSGNLAFGVFLAVVGALLTLNNFFDIDLEWIADWWPMLLFLIGVWVIINAIREKKEDSTVDEDDDFSV